jgi:pimeloyl-ACP methyl ester carboxylesterase
MLHALRDAEGPTLLGLHGLGGSAADLVEAAAHWPGPVYALDFTGHGRSDPLRGGGYQPELLAGDADAALAWIGPARLVGIGLGAWVALLLAGGRPDAVPAALLLPGRGLAGGGARPDAENRDPAIWTDPLPALPGCDPAVRRLDHDVRPLDYARAFADAARRLLLAEDGTPRPPWWEAVRACAAAAPAPGALADALPRLLD